MNLPETMQAMVMEQARQSLTLKTVPVPSPSERQVLVKIIACGVCRTDLHVLDGELTKPKLPLVIGHEIVAFHGSVTPVANANIAEMKRRIFVRMRCSPVIQ